MDALWFWLPKHANDPVKTTSSLEAGRSIVLMNRGDYWQCALMILKGSIDETRRAGLPALRAEIAQLVPAFADRVDVLADWDQIKLLTVAVNRLERWYRPGLLCIGDAAHAMSPLLGVGLGLSVQDAVAAANILARLLATGTLREADLERVQKRREFPTRLTQGIQMRMHKSIDRALQQADDRALEAPISVRLLAALPLLRRLPVRDRRDGGAPRARAYPSNRRCGRRWRACLWVQPRPKRCHSAPRRGTCSPIARHISRHAGRPRKPGIEFNHPLRSPRAGAFRHIPAASDQNLTGS